MRYRAIQEHDRRFPIPAHVPCPRSLTRRLRCLESTA